MTNTIGFLGTGKIAEPMIRSLLRRFPNCKLLLSHRSESVSSKFDSLQNVDILNNQEVISGSDTVVLSVLASVAREILPTLVFKPGQNIISVMADINLAQVAALTAPANSPCVTIPLPFIEQGGCPLPVFPASEVLDQLFGDENQIIVAPNEESISPHFAATAILSTTMKQLDTVSRWLATHSGDQTNAERYVISLVSGYLGALPKDGADRFTEAMQDLSTEGGLNNQLRKEVTKSGHFETLEQGLNALNLRLQGNQSG